MKSKEIATLFPYFPDGALFLNFETFSPPWSGDFDPFDLDLEYFTRHSGTKLAGPLLEFYTDKNTGFIPPENCERLASLLFKRFKRKWESQWETMFYDYNPIHNYDAEEEGHGDFTHGKKTDSHNTALETAWGYNSNAADENGDPVGKVANNGDIVNSGKDMNSHFWHRKGNIGVMSTQDLIGQEREIWRWQFIEEVFNDIDSIITIPIFNLEEEEK